LDGFTAAWAVWKRFPDTEFVAASYGDAPPDCTDRDVVMVDFSYKRPALLEIAAQAESVMILDHHKSAQAELVDLPDNVVAVFDMERSGAMLAWAHYHPDEHHGELVLHVQDRDLWQFKLTQTRDFCAHLFCLDFDFEEWDRVNAFCHGDDEDAYWEFVRGGALLQRKHHKDVKALIGAAAARCTLGMFNVPCLNAPFFFASDAGHLLCKGEAFAVIYYDTAEHRVFSLRSDEDGEDVSVIAQAYGGGGHKHAAGFKLSVPGVFRGLQEVADL
jgi:oligoribonuclease NrnB/cAMP/cGMP phosphodiesterase (DHH superfamily)